MKKIKFILLFCTTALIVKSQPWSEKLYLHPSSFCSFGGTVGVNSPLGFLMGGITPAAPTNSANFYIDRTIAGGAVVGAPFFNEYLVYGDMNCSSNAAQASAFAGITVIETLKTAANSPFYVMTGAYDQGCFYASLSSAGAPITTKFFPFPSGASNASKPLIVESKNTAYDYFICGSYFINNVQTMYVIKINLGGTVLQSKEFTSAIPGGDLFPNAIIYSPYGAELVIVGKAANLDFGGGPVEDRAFFVALNDNTLAINKSNLYGQTMSIAGTTDYFTSIAAAPSTTPVSAGYVVGGYSDKNIGFGLVWLMKLTPAGGVIWNSVAYPFSDPNAKDVVGVIERFSSTYNTTYYAAVTSALSGVGMLVLKFDGNGGIFSGNPTNEFRYPGPNLSVVPIPCAISYIDAGATDIGIHIYGTDDQASGGNTFFVEAGFNGLTEFTGCSNSQTASALSVPGPTEAAVFTITIANGLNSCSQFTLNSNVVTPTLSVLCSTNSLPAGSNNRPLGVIGNGYSRAGEFVISQDISVNSLRVGFSEANTGPVEIELYDVAGRFIKAFSIQTATKEDQSAELPLNGLSMESGIYIVSGTINGFTTRQKIIYIKNE